MSGEKCSAYSVPPDRNELLVLARAEEARRAARRAESAIASAIAAARQAGVTPDSVPRSPSAGASADELERFAASAHVAVRRIGAQVDEKRRLHRIQRLGEAAAAARDMEVSQSVARKAGVAHEIICSGPPNPGDGTSIEELDHYIAAVSAHRRVLDAETSHRLSLRDIGRVANEAARPAKAVSDWQDAVDQQSENGVAATKQAEFAENQNRVMKMLEGFPGDATDAELASIDALVGELWSSDSQIRRDNLEQQILLQVQSLKDRAAVNTARSAEAIALLHGLHGLGGHEVEAVRADLRQFLDGRTPWRDSLRERAISAKATDEKRINDAYVTVVLREELARLGYEVGEDFVAAFAKGGQVTISPPARVAGADYSIQMKVDAARGTIDVNVARFGEPGGAVSAELQLQDRDVETRWCADYHRIVQEAKHRGVSVDILRDVAAGARPIRVIAGGGQEKARRASKPEQKQFEG